MEVKLLDSTTDPLFVISMAARTCYNSRKKDTPMGRADFVKGLIKAGHCYDGETEVLTAEGFVKWKNYKGQAVAVVNKDGTFKGFEFPNNIISYNYTGKVYDYNELGTIVTEGHKLYGRTINNKKDNNIKNSYEYIYNLFACNEPNSALFTTHSTTKIKTEGERLIRVPSCCYKDNSSNDLAKLIGFWLGDGCRGDKGNKIYFHLKLKRKIDYLKNLCTNLGYSLIKHKNNKYVIEAPFELGKLVNEKYVKGNEKYIPFSGDVKWILGIIEGLLQSDGTTGKDNNHTSFCSTSIYIVNWLNNFACLAGYKVSVMKTITGANNRKNLYRITLTHFSKRGCPVLVNDSRKGQRVKIYDVSNMTVFCVQVSTGIIIVRGKNGQTFLCGNCTPLEFASATFDVTGISISCQNQMVRHRHASFCVQSGRYVDQRENECIIPYGVLSAYEGASDYVKEAKELYKKLVINGVRCEDARALLPQGMATRLCVNMNFRTLRHFLKLRLHPTAQWEVRQVAKAILEICDEKWWWLVEDIQAD